MNPTSDERTKFWGWAYARTSLLEARDYVRALQKGGLPHTIRHALITSFVVSYFRPFTETRVGGGAKIRPITAAYVPKALRSTHDDLEALRNRVFGHKDASETGPDGVIHKVLLHVDGSGVDVHTIIPIDVSQDLLAQSSKACDEIIAKVESEMTAFLRKHLKQPLASGWHEVLLRDENGAWIKQKR